MPEWSVELLVVIAFVVMLFVVAGIFSLCLVRILKTPERLERENEAMLAALRNIAERYENPSEKHNIHGGFPRGAIAWGMYNDARCALDGTMYGDRNYFYIGKRPPKRMRGRKTA